MNKAATVFEKLAKRWFLRKLYNMNVGDLIGDTSYYLKPKTPRIRKELGVAGLAVSKTKDNAMSVVYSAVDKRMQNKGIGSYLYNRALQDAKRQGYKAFTSDVTGKTSVQARAVWKNSLSKKHKVIENKGSGTQFTINLRENLI